MNNRLILTFLIFLITSFASAMLPRDAVTSLIFPVYGIYTTADPLCGSGFTATIPLASTPKNTDLISNPKFGAGKLADNTACVIVVVKNTLTYTVKAGTYTSTTSGSSDSVCNGGVTRTDTICSGGDSLSVASQIRTDLAAIGLSLSTSCQNATGNEIIALHISTASRCTGNNYYDPLMSPVCPGSGGQNHVNGFTAPTASSDDNHGVHLEALPAGKSSYKFVVDPDMTAGNSDGACSLAGPPRFMFKEKT